MSCAIKAVCIPENGNKDAPRLDFTRNVSVSLHISWMKMVYSLCNVPITECIGIKSLG